MAYAAAMGLYACVAFLTYRSQGVALHKAIVGSVVAAALFPVMPLAAFMNWVVTWIRTP
jgi:uncharacterized MnhB-related membrane protein